MAKPINKERKEKRDEICALFYAKTTELYTQRVKQARKDKMENIDSLDNVFGGEKDIIKQYTTRYY